MSAGWQLDQATGNIMTNIFYPQATQLQWNHQLAEDTISNNDSVATGESLNFSPGQSFTATQSGTITTIRIAANSTATDTLKIYSGAGTGGTELHSQSVTLTDTVVSGLNDYSLSSITLSTPVNITAGQIYTFAFTGTNSNILYDNQAYSDGILYADGGAQGGYDLVFEVVQSFTSGPTVTDGNISVTSSGTGSGGAYIVGDTITVRWDAGTDGNTPADISSVNMDLSTFGGGASVSASETSSGSGIWEASFTIVEGSVDATNLNATVTATDINGSTGPVSDTSNLTVDSTSPTVSDGNISISGASGTGGTYKIGDTVTATWNNTGAGDNDPDTISSVTVDFSAFGGGSAVAASNSSGTWTATYTIVSGAIDSTNLNVSVTATDNAGNQTTIADTTNASVDNEAPNAPSGSLDVDENSANSSSVGTVSASGATTFTLTNDANGRFAIDNSGNVTVADTSKINYENNTSHNITVQATDDAGNTNSNTLAVTINNVNEVPTLTATGSDPTFTEDGSAASLFTGASVSTIDAGQTISGMVITVTNVADSGNEILNIDGSAITLDNAETGTTTDNGLGFSVSVSANTATVTLSGGTLSAVDQQTLINNISYQNNSQTPSTSNRVVTITSLTDSGSDNNTASGLSVASTVAVNAVNDLPTFSNLDGGSTFNTGGSAIVIDSAVTVSDTELDALNSSNGNYDGATLTIVRNGGANADDVFGLSGGSLTQSGNLTVAATNMGTVTTNSNGTLVLTFNGSATTALVNQALQSLTYANSSNTPNTSVTLDWTFNDGTSNSTGTNQTTVSITPVNDAPVLDNTQTPALSSINEDVTTAANTGTDIATLVVNGSITDANGSPGEAIAVTAVDNTHGAWQYSTDNGTSWVNFSATTGQVVNLSSAARLLDGSLTAGSTQLVRFIPNADYNGSADITFRAWDKSTGSAGNTADTTSNGGSTAFSSATDTAAITITPVQDAPTAADDTQTITFNGSHTFATSDFGFSDVDSGDALVSVKIVALPTDGTLKLSNIDVTAGQVIPASSISNLVFAPTSGESGTAYATMSFTVNDGTDDSVTPNTITFDVGMSPDPTPPTPPAPPTPEPEPEPEPEPDGDEDGIDSDVEDQVPSFGGNGQGDGNGDGIADSEQADVASFVVLNTSSAVSNPGNATEMFLTLATGNDESLLGIEQLDEAESHPQALSMPLGMLQFSAQLANAGDSTTFTLVMSSDIAVNGYWKQDANDRWVNLASDEFGGSLRTENDRTVLTFTIEDGGQFDDDGAANGVIVDPGAPGLMAQAPDPFSDDLHVGDYFNWWG